MKKSKILVLASGSKYKRKQLEQTKIPFTIGVPRCVEKVKPGEPPEKTVARLAREKALSLLSDYDDAVIIGSDQGVEQDGLLLGKPQTVSAAECQLEKLSGKEHRLLTGVAVVDARRNMLFEELDICRLSVKVLNRKTISSYVASDSPLDCAGSYKFESRGVILFENVAAQDPTAIIGLPLIRLCRLLKKVGFDLLDR